MSESIVARDRSVDLGVGRGADDDTDYGAGHGADWAEDQAVAGLVHEWMPIAAEAGSAEPASAEPASAEPAIAERASGAPATVRATPVRLSNTVALPRSLRPESEQAAAGQAPVAAWAGPGDLGVANLGPAQIRVPARAQIPDDPQQLERKMSHLFAKACKDYGMIQPGDRVMVCMSGGKDSYGLLHFMQRTQKHSPVKFEIIAVHLDQGHPGFPTDKLENYLKNAGSPYEIIHYNTYDIVMDKLEPGKTTCSLCSRLRRGVLYDAAKRLGCQKIALGHHRDDILSTLLLNLFFCGQLKAMPPVLHADDGYNTVIRPMSLIPEAMLIKWSEMQQYPVIPCNLCSKQPDLKRGQMNDLLRELDKRYPSALPSALTAVQDVKPRFLLDQKLYNFSSAPAVGDDRDEEAFG